MNLINTLEAKDRISFGVNWVATDALPRDREQSFLLHEPTTMISNIDPITGRDVMDIRCHPFVVDGKMTSYFESETTRKAYLDTPVDHPFKLVDNPTEEGWAEG